MKIGLYGLPRTKNIDGINREIKQITEKVLDNITDEDELIYVGDNWYGLNMTSIPTVKSFGGNAVVHDCTYTVKAFQFDLIHSYYEILRTTKATKCARIYTVHDAIPLLFPDSCGAGMSRYYEKEYAEGLKQADKLIAISEATKNDIIRFWNIHPDKIKVIYDAATPPQIIDKELPQSLFAQIAGHPYALAVSTFRKYKNQEGLLKAFIIYKEKYPNDPLKLVLCGQNGESLLEKVGATSKIKNDVIYAGYVTDDELWTLYSNAICFVHVSFYEGFGLPILEAMSVGTPVICANVSSMPEVGGDAAYYCDPGDLDAIVNAFEKVIQSEETRKQMSLASIQQAKKFSWDKAARETIELYHEFR